MHQLYPLVITPNKKLHCLFRMGLWMLVSCFFVGCASKPPLISPSFPKTTKYSYRHNAPYNRPYTIKGKTYYPMRSAFGYSEQGIASWYGSESGNRTAMGTHFNPSGLTAAHKTLPLPAKVRVTNLQNGRSVVVIVNDRGPFKHNRLIDLSRGAARRIGLAGLTKVKVEYIDSMVSRND